MATRMQQRRGTAAEWTAANPVLANGEFGYDTTIANFKIGDGVTAWNALTYVYFRKSGGDSGSVVDLTVTGSLTKLTGTILATALPNAYPLGISYSVATTANGFPVAGVVRTERADTANGQQTLISRTGDVGVWSRVYTVDTAAWSAWHVASDYIAAQTAATLPNGFPIGTSLTTFAAAGSGNPDATNTFAVTTHRILAGSIIQFAAVRGTTVVPMYFRHSSSDTVWGPWQQIATKAEADAAYFMDTMIDAKGDLIVGSANDTPARLAVGTNDLVLIADSTQATGVRWGAPPAASFGFAEVFIHGGS